MIQPGTLLWGIPDTLLNPSRTPHRFVVLLVDAEEEEAICAPLSSIKVGVPHDETTEFVFYTGGISTDTYIRYQRAKVMGLYYLETLNRTGHMDESLLQRAIAGLDVSSQTDDVVRSYAARMRGEAEADGH